jgi:hypothetical protein
VVECSHNAEEHTASTFKVTETVPVDVELMRKKMCHLFRTVQGIQPIVAMASRKRERIVLSQFFQLAQPSSAYCSCEWPNSLNLSDITLTFSSSVQYQKPPELIQLP